MNVIKQHPKAVGDLTCAVVLARLMEVFDTVLLPFGENQRYDLAVEANGSFMRVQCKTGRLRNGVIKFPACSVNYEHPIAQRGFYARDYRGAADLFGIYCPENDNVYLVPVGDVGRKEGSLRVAPAKNNQAERIRWAADFEVKRGASRRRQEPLASQTSGDSEQTTLLSWN
jgi:hypothetical protein